MHTVVKSVFVIIGMLVAAQLMYVMFFVGPDGNGGAVVFADRAVESSMSDMYEKYVYDVNAYKYADFDEDMDNDDTVTDIFERNDAVEWKSLE